MLDQVFTLWGFLTIGAVCLAVAAVADTVAKSWRKARVAELDASLKAEMIKQGRSSDEIERILRAGSKSSGRDD
jgi:hypothetical protein